jgi:hypothetical protein
VQLFSKLFLSIVIGGAFAASHCFAINAASHAAKADSGDSESPRSNEDCDVARPQPALSPDLKKFKYTIKRDQNELKETVSKVGGYELTVNSGGCVDAASISLTFSTDEKAFPRLPSEQVTWVKAHLVDLNCSSGRCDMVKSALVRIGKHLANIKDRKVDAAVTNDITVCYDDSLIAGRDDECGWKTGGSTHFQVTRDGKGKIALVLEDANFL